MNSINIIKQIRTKRNFSANAFAIKLMISVVYLSMLENNKKKLSKRIVEKIVEIFPDLTNEERLSLENSIYYDVQETKKYITSLMSDFFYNLKQDNTERAKEDFELLKKAMGKLAKVDWTDEMVMLSKI